MFRRIGFICVFAFFAVMASAAATITPKKPSKVSGCYQISDAAELYGFASIVNGTDGFKRDTAACGKLVNNIVVNENVLDGSGNLNVADTANFAQWVPMMEFRGKFDGNSHTISGLYVNDEYSFSGLFGVILLHEEDSTVSIRNLGIVGSYFFSHSYVGAIAGFVGSGANVIIENCFSNSRIESDGDYAGGLVGMSVANILFKNVHNLGTVIAGSVAGGIAGYLYVGRIKVINAYNMGTVSMPSSSYRAGGLVGYVNSSEDASFENCFNMGSVTGELYIGGIVGDVGGTFLLMDEVYNAGTIVSEPGVVGRSFAGGLAGSVGAKTKIQNAYNTGTVSGGEFLSGIVGLSYADISLTNVYNVGTLLSNQSSSDHVKPIVFVDNSLYSSNCENVFYLNESYSSFECGTFVTSEQLEDGSIAYLLHNSFYDSIEATVWGQDVGNDPYPNFSGTITGASLSSFEDLILHTYDGDTTTLPVKYLPGFELKLPAVAQDNCVFHGWFDNAKFSGVSVDVVPSTAEGTQEFWAKFGATRQVTFETNGGTIDSEIVESYIEGVDSVALPDQVHRSGYIFNGWYEEENFSGNRVFEIGLNATGDKVFYAKWFEIKTPAKDANGCYVIHNAEELYGFAAVVNGSDGQAGEENACASLEDDIVVNKHVLDSEGKLNEDAVAEFIEWTPIYGFKGVFNGNMYSISGLYLNVSDDDSDMDMGYGLFGNVGVGSLDNPVTIVNVGVVDSYFAARNNVGALIGYVDDGSSYYDDETYLVVINSYSNSFVKVKDLGGGLFGYIGRYNVVFVENCYNLGTVYGRGNYLGGILGYKEYASDAYIVNCYNVGTIDALKSALDGALVGYDNDDVIVVNSFYLKSKWDQINVGQAATAEQFANGSVALALRSGSNGAIWGQNVGVDPLPNFSRTVKNSTATQYNVSFYTFPGDKASYFDSYVAGFSKPLPDTVYRNGYIFDGWYADSSYSGSMVDSILASDEGNLYFYAKFTPIEYKIRVSSANPSEWGEVVVLNASASYYYGDTVKLKAIPAPGYEFQCWRDDVDNTNPNRTYVVRESRTFIAYFKLATLSSSSNSSSSSAKSSSSSAESSSSKDKSSSSIKVASSSSRAKSSSARAKSSSSKKSIPVEFHILCNGKECSDALPSESLAPQFHIIASVREIWVMDAHIGKPYALFDMQGRMLRKGYVLSPDFAIPVDNPGSYLVRIGNQMRSVSVR
jgi:Listeria/Bacterioides repeat